MTDKEKIRAEIVRLYKENKERVSIEGISAATQLWKVINYIDSLPEEPVSEDLEKEIDRCIMEEDMNYRDFAYHFTNRQKEQMINKACEWLKLYRQDTPDGTGYIAGIINDTTIEDFRKAMEEEK